MEEEPGENLEAAGVEKNKTPEELEAEEAAMEKVVDINAPGTFIQGVKNFDPLIFKSILKSGILPPKVVEKLEKKSKLSFPHKRFSENENKHRNSVSMSVVSIVDSEYGLSSNASGTRAGWHFRESSNGASQPDGIGLVIDSEFIARNKKSLNNYDTIKYGNQEALFKGIIPPSAIKAVISPRRFSDLVIKTIREARSVGDLFIYDSEGNLVWPRKMSYEEVKAFVAEREAKKAKEKEEGKK